MRCILNPTDLNSKTYGRPVQAQYPIFLMLTKKMAVIRCKILRVQGVYTFQLLAGDLRIGCPSVSEVIRDTVSSSPVTVESFQLLPTSCIAFAASLTMTCKNVKFIYDFHSP